MKKNSKGNILITFIMITALSIMVFSFISLMLVRLKDSGQRVSEAKAFYIADAGLEKAFWYLSAATADGGKGVSWRISGSSEGYAGGTYTFSIINTIVTNEIQLISTGEVNGIKKTVMQKGTVGGYPIAFDYAMYTASALDLAGNAEIQGDVYVNGNTNFSGNTDVTDGYVYHAAGSTVSGHGTFTDGGTPVPTPPFPTLDTSFYANQITTAQGATAANVTYNNNTYNLNGGIIYVHGNVTISGNTTFVGPGTIVATGTFNMSGNTYTSGGTVNFIASNDISLSGNTYTEGAVYYSDTSISASGNTRVQVGGFLTSGNTSLSGNLNLSGLIYSGGVVSMSGNPVVTGAVISGSSSGVTGLSGNARITYDSSVFPVTLPPGFAATSIAKKKGSWKGI